METAQTGFKLHSSTAMIVLSVFTVIMGQDQHLVEYKLFLHDT